jgi:Rrf2 family protein
MAELHARVRYALRAAIDLAEHYDGENPVKIGDIAARTAVPPKYLVHILLSLKRRLLVNSTRGPSGGYWLVRRPGRIKVAEVVDAVQSARARRDAPALEEVPCDRAINEAWRRAERARHDFLDRLTLEDLLPAP